MLINAPKMPVKPHTMTVRCKMSRFRFDPSDLMKAFMLFRRFDKEVVTQQAKDHVGYAYCN